jgi:hypothetical protein
MTEGLLLVFVVACGALLAWGLRGQARIYEFPFLAGAVFAGWILPQAIGLLGDTALPPNGLDKALMMTILCLGMCYWGYIGSAHPVRSIAWRLDQRKLLRAAAVLSLVGAFFFFLISRLPEELTATGAWTGLPVAYLFFAEMLNYGFAIAVLIFAATRSRSALIIILFDCLLYFDRIVIAGRRAVALEFLLVILCALWFTRRFVLPRWAMMATLIIGTLLVFSTGDYRATTYRGQAYGSQVDGDPPWEKLLEIDFEDNFLDVLENGANEYRNAVFAIAAKDYTGTYNLGLGYWNDIIFKYVPAQLLGEELKRSLMIDLPNDRVRVYAYFEHPGTTRTGMSDSFESFWYFGCLIFFVIARVLRKLFSAAQAGHFIAAVCYVVIITDAMHAITHNSSWFLLAWPHMIAFLLPALWYARKGNALTPCSVPPVLRQTVQ